MIDITHKIKTHRLAIAQAIVTVQAPETMLAVKNKSVPKGDVLEAARVAGLLGIKQTSALIPDCHPLPIEFAKISFRLDGLDIYIEAEVHTIYRTGVEVEAMHGVSVAALTIYDMLKPIDKNIEIRNMKLLRKKGGKSQYNEKMPRSLQAAVLVCSDSIAAGKKEDSAGKTIMEKLGTINISIADYSIIPDEEVIIREKVLALCDRQMDMVILTGGTGLSPRDVTPEAVMPLLERVIPGIGEAARNYGQEQTPYAMLSRSVAGLRGDTLILALPGSTRGAGESMDALFPYILHVFKVQSHFRHDEV